MESIRDLHNFDSALFLHTALSVSTVFKFEYLETVSARFFRSPRWVRFMNKWRLTFLSIKEFEFDRKISVSCLRGFSNSFCKQFTVCTVCIVLVQYIIEIRNLMLFSLLRFGWGLYLTRTKPG